MQLKSKVCCLITACSLFFSLFSIDVFAKTDKNQEDPETVQWKERESYAENFTDTEQPSATLALRTECFTGFTGKISVTIQKENGASRQYELSEDNLYEQNIPVNTGIYMVKSVEAADEECVYKTEYSPRGTKGKTRSVTSFENYGYGRRDWNSGRNTKRKVGKFSAYRDKRNSG